MPISFKTALGAYAIGRRANMEEWNTITRTAAAALGFGVPARASGEHSAKVVSDQTITATVTNGSPAPAGATAVAVASAGSAPALGVYYLRAITAGATGKWNVYGPDGEVLGQVTTGTPSTVAGLTITVTDSGTDPAIGEEFRVTVTSDLGAFLGVTETSQVLPHTGDAYAQYDNAAICNMGVIGVACGGAVVAGQPAAFNGTTGKWVAVAAGFPAQPGCRFETSGTDTTVALRVRVPVNAS